MTMKIPELLAPAGSFAALRAAVFAGADAVYFGGKSFNARIGAENFDESNLADAVSFCRAYGVKSYITLNTLTYGKELPDILKYAEFLYKIGTDALIVADIGIASLLHKYIPDFPLHASTQMSGHSVGAAKELLSLGFSRMVCAREMSLENIKYFTANSPLEAEVFVHGALCVSHSGQCLFSSIVGGRSGNRGECAGPCRLDYSYTKNGEKTYPLSLRDLCLAEHIPELSAAGVASLKIEGRMKSPEYVFGVTKIYRRLLDENRAATGDEMNELSQIFSRSGFTDGYFTSKISKTMTGVRTDADKETSRLLDISEKTERKIPLDMTAEFKLGEPCKLTVKANGKEATAYGFSPIQAISSPTTRENVVRSLSKLGATPYVGKNISVSLDENLLIPVSKINNLRRSALEKLNAPEKKRTYFELSENIGLGKPKYDFNAARTARFLFSDSIPENKKELGFFDIIYLPLAEFCAHPNKNANGIILPPVIFDSETESVCAMLQKAKDAGIVHALVGNIGHLALAKKYGFICHGDFRLNVYNVPAKDALLSLGFFDVILSPELTLPQARDIGKDTSVAVYGRIPLMLLEKCAISNCGDCKKRAAKLYDRRGVCFPVYEEYKHRNVIYNSVVTYMADKADLLQKNRIAGTHFIFTDEKPADCIKIINAYKNGLAPQTPIRRI